MDKAIAIAEKTTATGDVPVGAVVINKDGIVVGSGSNQREVNNDPTAHAEIVAIRNAASRLQNSRLDGCTLIVTLEPCAMCAGAIAQARISHLIFGAWDKKAGAVGSVSGARSTVPTEVVVAGCSGFCFFDALRADMSVNFLANSALAARIWSRFFCNELFSSSMLSIS
jgi:tRNA(adenine34) deaminase